LSSVKCPQCGLVTWAGAAKCKRCGAAIDSSHQSPASSATQFVRAAKDAPSKKAVRLAGLKTIKAGALITVLYVIALIVVIVVNSAPGGYEVTFKLIGFAGLLPVAMLLAGVLQIVTGVPFQELNDKWDNLAGWQRGLIGISVFLGGLLVLAIACMVILVVLDWGSGRPFF